MIKKLFSKLQHFLLGLYIFNRGTITFIGEWLNLFKKRDLIRKVTISINERRMVQDFYKKNYGKVIPMFWHRLYQSYTGTFCVEYFPEILFSTKLERKMNPFRPIASQFGDKNLLHQLFNDVNDVVIPFTFFSCVNGVYRDKSNRLISYEELLSGVSNIHAVIKKTIDSSSGSDVLIFDTQNGVELKSGKDVGVIISEFGNNFVIQQKINQNMQLQNIYSKSLNTFRVMTYILNNDVRVCPISLRIGRGGADKDNIHHGGIVIGVDQSGRLREKAFSEYGESFSIHPDSGVVFSEIRFDFINKIKSRAIELHSQLPWLGIISWDLSVDENGNVVLIEMNTTGQSAWFPQMVNGEPLFGSDTSEILKLIKR